MQKNVLVLVRGIPGAGKTSFAEAMAKLSLPKAPVISADDFFIDDKGNYNFRPSLLGIAHESCRKRTEIELSHSTPIVFVANTFTTKKEMTPYFDLADAYNYKVFSVIVENRHGNVSIHNVPEESIEKMKERFSINL